MTSLSPNELLKYVRAQMAAEALYTIDARKQVGEAAGTLLHPGDVVKDQSISVDWLKTGNGHASKFTELDAEQFSTEWQIVEHKSNTATGFSGTLFKRVKLNPVTGDGVADEYVLSLRSTEFIDDAARDNQATNTLEIKEKGWAFGQIDDLDQWYKTSLKSKIGSAKLNVTGYSLGGHLATAFNLMHGGELNGGQVVTFNGAGVGKILGLGSLASSDLVGYEKINGMIARFHQLRSDKSAVRALFKTTKGKALFDSLSSEIASKLTSLGGDLTVAELDTMLFRAQTEVNLEIGSGQDQALLSGAILRIRTIAEEGLRVRSLPSGVTGEDPDSRLNSTPADVFGGQIDAERLEYQLAVLATSAEYKTEALSLVDGGIATVAGKTYPSGQRMGNQLDVVATEYASSQPMSMVANSQVHYGVDRPIYVEDQPGYRGDAVLAGLSESAKYWGIKLLEPNYSTNDFGDTHSLVLLQDSLMVQAVLSGLDPTVSDSTLTSILKACAPDRASKVSGTAGFAEGNTLESLVNALGRSLGIDKSKADEWINLDGSLKGDTWYYTQKPATDDTKTGRDALHKDLDLILKSPEYKALAGKVRVELASTLNPSIGKTDFAAFVCLQTLSPVRLVGTTPDNQAALAGALATPWNDSYTKWKADQDLKAIDITAGKASYSDTWYDDRCKMLGHLLASNRRDQPWAFSGALTDEAWDFADHQRNSKVTVLPSPPTVDASAHGAPAPVAPDKHHYVTFAKDGTNETLTGAALADHLYGASGNDTITAGAGDDRLEGGSGADVLKGEDGNDRLFGGDGADLLSGGLGLDSLTGGAGGDTFSISEGDGWDTITDADADDRLLLAGTQVKGDGTKKIADNLWKSADGQFTFALFDTTENGVASKTLTIGTADGTTGVRVKNFTDGNLGISLTTGIVSPPATDVGGSAASAGDPYQVVSDGADCFEAAYWWASSDKHVSTDMVVETNSGAGNDMVAGINVAGYLDVSGSTGHMVLVTTGQTADRIDGGAGNDWLLGDGDVFGSAAGTTSELTGGNDTINGGLDDDFIAGGAGRDVLNGGNGNDLVFGDGGAGISPWLVEHGSDQIASVEEALTWALVGQYFRRGRFSYNFASDSSAGTKGYLIGGYQFDFGENRSGSIHLATVGSGDKTYNYTFTKASDTAGPSLTIVDASSPGSRGTYDVWIGDQISTSMLPLRPAWRNSLLGTVDLGASETLANAIDGGAGDDGLFGSDGNDSIAGGIGNDTLFGNGGDDELFGADGQDTVIGGAGNDGIDGGSGADLLVGETGDDRLYGGDGNDSIEGDSGSDVLKALGGGDYIEGGAGNDYLFGGGGNDTVYGGTDNDTILGDFGGADFAAVGGNDSLSGDAGADTILGGIGSDTLDGGADGDYLDGGEGNDLLKGGDGNDTVMGGAGNDTLIGGPGVDVLKGGGGADVYVFDYADLAGIPSGTTGGTAIVSGVYDDTLDNNTVVLEGGGAFHVEARTAATGTNDLAITLENDRALVVIGGMDGAVATYEGFADSPLSWTDFVGHYFVESRTLNASGSHENLVGGAAADMISLADSARGTTISGGRGEDTIRLGAAEGVQLQYNEGDGSDNVEFTIGGATRTGPNVLNLGKNLSLDGLRLHKLADGTGFKLTLDANDGGLRFVTDSYNNNMYLSKGPFDVIAASDGSTLSWADLIKRGVFVETPDGSDVVGTDANDEIHGSSAAVTLRGGFGNDTIYAGSGNETIEPAGGSDTVIFSRGFGRDRLQCSLDAPPDADKVQFSADLPLADATFVRISSTLYIRFASSDDILTLSGYYSLSSPPAIAFADGSVLTSDSISLSPVSSLLTEQADTLVLTDSADLVDAQGGNDTIRAGAGNDSVSGGDGDDVLSGEAGADLLLGQAGGDTLNGDDGNDTLIGGEGADYLLGGSGNDVLEDHSGNGDTLSGDSGADTYRVGPLIDGAWAGSVVIRGGSDGDTLEFGEGVKPQDVKVDRDGRNSVLTIADASGKRPGTYTVTLRDQYFSIPGTPGFLGQVDQFRFASDSSVHWSKDDIDARLFTATDGNDHFSGYSDIANTLAGGKGDDSLSGNVLNDTLNGGEGRDTLIGQGGDDAYLFGDADGIDAVLERPGEGSDRIVLGAGVLPANVTLYRTPERPKGIVSSGDSLVIRLSSGNEIWVAGYFATDGVGSIETVQFQEGTVWHYADVVSRLQVIGSASTQSLSGSAGDDSYTVKNPGDTITESVGAGNDSVVSSVSYTLPVNVENLTLTGNLSLTATGNSLTNILTGNDGANTLDDGGDGADTLIGGAGDDTYRLISTVNVTGSSWSGIKLPYKDVIVETAGGGYDEVITNAATAYLPANIEKLTVYSRRQFSGATVSTGESFDYHYVGNAQDNVIDVSKGIFDSVSGLRPVVTLDGGAGSDTMVGSGNEDDVYVVDSVGDVIVEQEPWSKSLNDRVVSTVSYTLGKGLENLELSGSDSISGTGNELANILDGTKNAAANKLIGGTGNDTYRLGLADTVEEYANGGIDTAIICYQPASGSIRLADMINIEGLTLGKEAGAASIAGADGSEVLTGNSLDNKIDGGNGDDTLYDVDVANVPYDKATGQMWYPYDSDTLLGGAGNDTLYSYGGQDYLDGGAGQDKYILESTARVAFGVGSGADTVCGGRRFLAAWTDGSYKRVSANIALAEGTNLQALRFSMANVGSAKSLLVSLAGTADSITISDFVWATPTSGNSCDAIVTSDGSVLTRDTLVLGALGGDRVTATDAADLLTADLGGTVSGGGGNDWILGAASNESLQGDAGDDTIVGGAGADLLEGGAGNDLLSGGVGSDTYQFDRGWGMDLIDDQQYALLRTTLNKEPNVTDVVSFGAGIRKEDLVFALDYSDLVISSKIGADSVRVSNFLDEEQPTRWSIRFSDGTSMDRAAVENACRTLTGTAGNDAIATVGVRNAIVFAGAGDDTVQGDAWPEQLFGESGNDSLIGGYGADWLDGGSGVDTMQGGIDDDTYVVDNAADIVLENAGEGDDTVLTAITFTLPTNTENLTLTGTSAANGTGNAAANVLTGNSASNILSGLAGVDTMVGGIGDDTYVVDNVADQVIENSAEGTDLVLSSVSYSLADGVENLTLTGTGGTSGTGNDSDNILTGNSGANALTGGAGNDRLVGMAGKDTMAGGVGDDTYVVDVSTDVIVENANEGTDTVESAITLTLAANVENLTLTGATVINGTGNGLNNVLKGNTAANVLSGGVGADTMVGGAGDDTYVVDNAADVVTELAGEGTELVQSSVTYTLGANVENLTLTGTNAINGTGNGLDNLITGNSAANSLTGGAGNDRLVGMAGADTMIGGTGNDTYVVDATTDVVTESANEGTDTVESSVSLTLSSNVENLILTGTSALTGTGNALNNVLTGNSGANKLTGGAGSDRLIGLAGNDTMLGGTGDDTYVVDVATDVVTENANEGTDTVESSVTLTLAANVENLSLTGTAAINGTGNTLANVLVGNAAANSLSGAAGTDTLQGGIGNDSLDGGVGNDTYLFTRGDQADTLTDADATAGNQDTILFGAGVTADQLWFRKVGTADLEVSIIGTTDKITIKNWSASGAGTNNQIEVFKTADGRTLSNAKVANLVNAMATLTVPPLGQTTLSTSYQTSLLPTINANWTAATLKAAGVAQQPLMGSTLPTTPTIVACDQWPEAGMPAAIHGSDHIASALIHAMAGFGTIDRAFDRTDMLFTSAQHIGDGRQIAVRP